MAKTKSNGKPGAATRAGTLAKADQERKPFTRRQGRGAIKEKLLASDPTRDYNSTRFTYFGELFVQNIPLYRLWTGRLMLTSDPLVQFSLNVRNAALMAADIVIETGPGADPRLRPWLEAQWDVLWNHHRVKLTSAKRWGFMPLQVLYEQDKSTGPMRGLLSIKGVKDFAPEDCRALEQNNRLVGQRVKGHPLFFPQALWLTFNAEAGSSYGIGCLRRSYPPWYEKWMDHGAKRLLQLRMIKDAYIGDIFWYPPNQMIKLPDGTTLSWRDLMREIGENRLSGGALTLPMFLDENGNELTKYQPPMDTGGATQIFEWVDHCDEGILRGADIPMEVVRAADTGSGFSGRSIPFLVVLSVCTQELTEIVQRVDEQVLRPGAWLNFGGDPDYKIYPRSLVESFGSDTSGSSLAGSSIGSPASAAPPSNGQPVQLQQGGAVQYEEEKPSWWHEPSDNVYAQGMTHGQVIEDYLHRHKNKADSKGLHTFYHASPSKHQELKAGSLLEHDPESAAHFASRDRGLNPKDMHIHTVKVRPHQIHAGVFPSLRENHKPHEVKQLKHFRSQHEEEQHSYSSTQFNLPGDLAFEVRMLGERIHSEDLAEEGRELNPHVTALYGLHTNDPDTLKPLVTAMPPIAIQLGKVSVFHADRSNPVNFGVHDVVKIDVISKGLHKLHQALRQLPNSNRFPDYKPHITIAYVKPGMGEMYAKRLNVLEGKTAVFERLIFSNRDREHFSIPLTGQAQFAEAPPKPAHLFQHGHVESHEGYRYHATNEQSLGEIAHSGVRTHRPWHGTDQSHWPDGSRERRSYWHHNANTTKSFAPAHGKPVLLRSKVRPHMKTESTGDTYATKGVHAKHLEYLGEGGTWHPVTSLASQHQEEVAPSAPFCCSVAHEGVWQFAESDLVKQLREFIQKGTNSIIKDAATRIRELRRTNLPVPTLAQVIEREIAALQPLLANDLATAGYGSALQGMVDSIDKLRPLLPKLQPQPKPGDAPPPTVPQKSVIRRLIEEAGENALPYPSTAAPPPSEAAPVPLEAPLQPPTAGVVPKYPLAQLPALDDALLSLEGSSVAAGINYRDTAEKVRQGAFAVTGDLTDRAVTDLRDLVAEALREGTNRDEFIEQAATALETEGALSPPHLETIFRTNTAAYLSEGQAKALEQPMVVDAFPYVAYSATTDARVRPEHLAMERYSPPNPHYKWMGGGPYGLNGTNIYRTDDPTWKKFRPPWDYNCRCAWSPVTVEQAARKGVLEAKDWLERAKATATEKGGTFHQWLNSTAPATPAHVTPPPFEPSPEFSRGAI